MGLLMVFSCLIFTLEVGFSHILIRLTILIIITNTSNLIGTRGWLHYMAIYRIGPCLPNGPVIVLVIMFSVSVFVLLYCCPFSPCK